jgi:hypothetical protein
VRFSFITVLSLNEVNLFIWFYYFENFNLRLLVTTLTLLSAIAEPAIIGLRRNPFIGNKIPAARGIPMILYINAQKRFCRIVLTVFRLNLIAKGMIIRSLLIIVIFAASIAISEPLPIAILTSAVARA